MASPIPILPFVIRDNKIMMINAIIEGNMEIFNLLLFMEILSVSKMKKPKKVRLFGILNFDISKYEARKRRRNHEI